MGAQLLAPAQHLALVMEAPFQTFYPLSPHHKAEGGGVSAVGSSKTAQQGQKGSRRSHIDCHRQLWKPCAPGPRQASGRGSAAPPAVRSWPTGAPATPHQPAQHPPLSARLPSAPAQPRRLAQAAPLLLPLHRPDRSSSFPGLLRGSSPEIRK